MTNTSIKNFSFMTIGQVIATAFHALFYLIFATILDPEVYGEVVYWIAIAGFVSTISRFGMPYSVTVYQAKEKISLVKQVNSFVIISSSIAAIILIPFNIFAAFFSLGLSLFYMNQHNLLGLKKYKNLVITVITRSILFLGLPILFYFLIEIPGILIGLAIANIIPSFTYFKFLSKTLNSFHEFRQNFKVLIHNFGVDLSNSLPGTIDKLLIVPILGFTIVGYYQFNLQILTALSILPALLHGFILTEEASKKTYNKVIYLVILISIILTFVTIFSAPYIIEHYFTKFAEGIFSLQILSLSLIPLSLAYVLNAKLQAQESTTVGYSLLVRIGSLVGLILLLGTFFDLFGLSLAVLFSNLFYAGFLGLLFYKRHNL